MKKIVLVNGFIGGLIVAAMMLYSAKQCVTTGNFENGMIYGYTSMLLAFAFVFVGIKSFRDKYNNGIISFGKAFQIGLWITLIASSFYVLTWQIDYYCFFPDFGEKYAAHMLAKAKAGGASEAAMAKQTADMLWFKEVYKQPLYNILFTYAEILPVGLVITFISSLILKRKKTKQEQTG
ncbi:MAG: hypothetical protein RLZZ28_2276 [Bacteroidota bacterium]|jgi:hypothetical protein